MTMPTRAEAEQALEQAGKLNPGKWTDHSHYAAQVCERIAQASGMDSEKAYIFGLLHDIGRQIGRCGQKHIYAGYTHCMQRGWDEIARISLAHSYLFNEAELGVPAYDGPAEEALFIKDYIQNIAFDDYDRLVQLADAMADSNGFCLIEKRIVDVALRYGNMPGMIDKWRKYFELKTYFDNKCGQSIYNLLPGIRDNIE